jgi:hypothetical protein
MKMTRENIEKAQAVVKDTKKSLTVRRRAYKELMDGMLNPKSPEEFDPETFDPMDSVDDFEVKKRSRKEPPRRLPTMGLKPKELFEGQMVGMFESKQDLYLLIAWLSGRVSDLEDEVKRLRGG